MPARRLTLAAVALFATACATPPAPPAPAPTATGSQPAGPVIGDGERTLLQDYEALLRERDTLQARLATLEAERDRERDRAGRAEAERDEQRQGRTVAEVENRRFAERTRDLESKVLALGIANAELERELLQVRIRALEAELAGAPGAVAPTATPARPPGGER